MFTIDVNPSDHQLKIPNGYKVYQCKDCYGFFFIPIDRKTKVEEAAPNHTWNPDNPRQLRHLTKEDRERRVNTSLHPWPTTIIKIIKAILKKSNLNVTEITKKTGLSSRTINKALKKLELIKIVNHHWDGKNKRFTVDKIKAINFLVSKENYWQYMSDRDLQSMIRSAQPAR
jgi:predicted transcriptional regulator